MKKYEIGPYSAYAIAVKHGFVGTEAEWIASTDANRTASEEAKKQAEKSAGTAAESATEAKAALDQETGLVAAEQKRATEAEALLSGEKVAYGEVSDGVLICYADTSKTKELFRCTLPSGGSGKTYTIKIDGHTLTLTDSDGNVQSVDIPVDWTEEQIRGLITGYGYALASDTYTKTETDTALDTKIDSPTDSTLAVGKVLKVLSVNDDGTFTCTWSDEQSGGVSDVTVNDASVVTDGVAKIPIANTGYGLVKAGQGIQNINGTLNVLAALNLYINNRASGYNPIVPTNMDYAYKKVASAKIGTARYDSATGDYYYPEWTDDEKKTAQERMGIMQMTAEEYGLISVPSDHVIYILTDTKHMYIGSNLIF